MPRIETLLFASVLALALSGCGSTVAPIDNGSGGSTSADTTAPTVSIASPTTSGSYSTTSATVSLGGSASDNVGVASVTWRNLGNGTTGSASGTGSWNIASVTLAQGTNQITVTAHDAAGNTGGATLTVTFNPGGPVSLSGGVDSSLINRSSGANTVYIYSGTVTPTVATVPFQTAPVTQDNGACTFSYQFASLPAGSYTVAFSSDATAFRGTAPVTVPASGTVTHDFGPNRRLQVGPTRAVSATTFKLPSDAIAAAQAGDAIEIDSGTDYVDDSAIIGGTGNLTLRGVGGARAHLRATTLVDNDKGILVMHAPNITVENIEFSGARSSSFNGAGVRGDPQGTGITICNGYFHDNENGVLGGAGAWLIEYSEFDNNGAGDGQTHNIYIDGGTSFTLRYSYSHRAVIGHLVKTRALNNYILYNRIMDEQTGTASYQINIPQNGLSFVIGNLIQQGPNNDNNTLISYGEDPFYDNGRRELYVVNNTFVNEDSNGTFVYVGNLGTTTGKIVNNIFAGPGGVLVGTNTMTQTTNLVSANVSSVGFVNSAGFDYHLTAGASGAINKGSDPGTGASVSLTPTSQYVHPTNRQDRPINGTIDIGAYEFP